jgi:hypothetical protein
VIAVTTLTIYRGLRYEWLIRPSATAVIASKMPQLQNVVLNLWDNEKQDQDLCKCNWAGKLYPPYILFKLIPHRIYELIPSLTTISAEI